MAGKRSYGDACGIARALDLVGERWTLLVVRELLLGPKRYRDLQEGLVSISPDVLSQRLRDLVDAGLAERTTLPPPARTPVYALTDTGRALEPVLLALGRFGAATAPFPEQLRPLSRETVLLSLPTLFDPAAADDLDATVALDVGDERFVARIADGEIDVRRAHEPDPDVRIATDHGTLFAVLRGWRTYAQAEADGALTLDGDRALAERFAALFPLPEGAPALPGAR